MRDPTEEGVPSHTPAHTPTHATTAHVPAMRARLHGLHRGADVSGEIEVLVEDRGLRLALPGGPALPVPWAALDGVAHTGSTLTLFLAGDDVLELDDVDDAGGGRVLARIVAQRACRLGELTLALRGLGSARARPGSDHQRFYGPLLEARRALESSHGPEEQLDAVRAEKLASSLRASLASFASDRYPDDAADRRALEAELLDYAVGLLDALERLASARDAARQSPADERFARWRDWVTELRAVFAEHDRTWIAALPALCDPRAPKGGFWRRLLGRTKP
jgi:hypothetical protein